MQAANGAAVSIAIDPAWQAQQFYFKAGSYVQAQGSSSSDGAVVRFHHLQLTHAP